VDPSIMEKWLKAALYGTILRNRRSPSNDGPGTTRGKATSTIT
jgi:hypothetical protein